MSRLIHCALAATLLFAAGAAWAQSDPRFCGAPERTADGAIKRSTTQRALFVRAYPCPATGAVSGACPGWGVDHVIPLACGGCDAPMNMQWLPLAIKSCSLASGVPCKDRWERRVYKTAFAC